MKKFICIALAAMALILTGFSSRDAFCAGHGGGGYGGHGGGYGGHGGGGYGGHGGGWYGGHGGVGVWVGPGWGPGWWDPFYPYYPYYPYYAEPPVVIEKEPDTYIQEAPQAEEPSYWYFCPDPKGYYPYVKKCPKGWLKVVPSPAPEEEEE